VRLAVLYETSLGGALYELIEWEDTVGKPLLDRHHFSLDTVLELESAETQMRCLEFKLLNTQGLLYTQMLGLLLATECCAS
jgi:hypothetical protein